MRTEAPPDPAVEALERAGRAGLTFGVPSEMRLHARETVSFRPASDFRVRLQQALESRGINADALSTRLEPVLSASDPEAFDVKLERKTDDEWVWSVVPRTTGRHTLNVNVNLTANVDGKTYQRTFPAASQEVLVETDTTSALEAPAGAPWLWPTLVLAAVAAFLIWLRQWRRRTA